MRLCCLVQIQELTLKLIWNSTPNTINVFLSVQNGLYFKMFYMKHMVVIWRHPSNLQTLVLKNVETQSDRKQVASVDCFQWNSPGSPISLLPEVYFPDSEFLPSPLFLSHTHSVKLFTLNFSWPPYVLSKHGSRKQHYLPPWAWSHSFVIVNT